MFSTKTATVNNTEFTSTYMPVGINDNVTLKEVNVKSTPNGRDFLEIVFENGAGQTASLSEWKNEKNMWIKTDDELQARDNQQFGRILSILNCFYPNGVAEVSLSTFKDMITWVKSQLDPVVNTKKLLRLKTIYDKNGYVRVSSNGLFVEPMDIAESQIKLFKRDLLERPVVADDESTTDPLATANIVSTPENVTVNHGTDTNELPF